MSENGNIIITNCNISNRALAEIGKIVEILQKDNPKLRWQMEYCHIGFEDFIKGVNQK